jgi:hypothetical protein
VFPRPHVHGLFGRGRDSGEIALAVGMAGVGVIWALLAPSILLKGVGLAAAPALGATVVFVPYRGRTFYRWWEIDRSYKRLLRKGHARWRSPAPEMGIKLNGDPREMAPPIGVGRLTWWSVPTTNWSVTAREWSGTNNLCVVLQQDRRVLTAAIEIEGAQVFTGLDTADQEQVIASYDLLLAEVANGRTRINRVQMLSRVVPSDPEAHARDVAARRDEGAQRWLLDSYDALQSTVTVEAEEHRIWCVAQIDYTQELAGEAAGYDTIEEGLARLVAGEMEGFAHRLNDADLRLVRPLGEPELAAVIHSTYDPNWRIDDTAGLNRATAWPAEIDARNRGYVAARSWSTPEPWLLATAWWMQLPQTPVGINFLAPLLMRVREVIRTTSVVMDLIPSDVALDRLLSDLTVEHGKSTSAHTSGQVGDPRQHQQLERLHAATRELAEGAAGVYLTAYVTIAARSVRDLEIAKREIESAAGKSQLRLQWCDGEHWRAIVNTLPLAQGLRRDG